MSAPNIGQYKIQYLVDTFLVIMVDFIVVVVSAVVIAIYKYVLF